jgi:hypothetical protein
MVSVLYKSPGKPGGNFHKPIETFNESRVWCMRVGMNLETFRQYLPVGEARALVDFTQLKRLRHLDTPD